MLFLRLLNEKLLFSFYLCRLSWFHCSLWHWCILKANIVLYKLFCKFFCRRFFIIEKPSCNRIFERIKHSTLLCPCARNRKIIFGIFMHPFSLARQDDSRGNEYG